MEPDRRASAPRCAPSERKLRYITLERDELGGTVAKYPRQKLVMTSPVEFPMYGKFKKTELSKEELLAFWNKVLAAGRLQRSAAAKRWMTSQRDAGRHLHGGDLRRSVSLRTPSSLAIGRTGTPRKLGVKGEELPKVMYRLIEADHYVNKKILIVGGGDSAIEAAMGLALQAGNQVTLSYRQGSFTRIKERNSQRIAECIRKGKQKVLFNSNPVEFKAGSVGSERQ